MTADNNRRDQQRAANRARNRAYRELSRAYPDAFHTLYEKAALDEGVVPNTVRRAAAAALVEGRRGEAR